MTLMAALAHEAIRDAVQSAVRAQAWTQFGVLGLPVRLETESEFGGRHWDITAIDADLERATALLWAPHELKICVAGDLTRYVQVQRPRGHAHDQALLVTATDMDAVPIVHTRHLLWEVTAQDGRVLIRSADPDLADDIYRHAPVGSHLAEIGGA